MLLQRIWQLMMIASVAYACLTGGAERVLPAALSGAADAVALTLRLCAGYLFFCGLIEILKALKAPERLCLILRPVLRRLMPSLGNDECLQAVTLNLTANLLGLGNAATPSGIRAMSLMDEERKKRRGTVHAMYMLLILNATSLQLLPTTVLTLRVAAGSAAPNAILLPTFACTGLSAAVGVGLGLCCMRGMEAKGE